MLKKILAYFDCDKCGEPFTALIPSDADNTGNPTVFETILMSSDQALRESSHCYEEWGENDGEHYGPCCWPKVSEELFIAEIKQGKYTAEQLEGLDPDYVKYLPVPQLEHHT